MKKTHGQAWAWTMPTEEPRQNSPPLRSEGLSHGYSELWPRPAEIRIADEVLTTPAEAALESEQIDKAMAAIGTA